MSEKNGDEGNFEIINQALVDQQGFEKWLNALPEGRYMEDIVTEYLTQKTGLRKSDVSFFPRPEFLNKFDGELNLKLENSPKDIIKGARNVSHYEEEGFSKQELVDVYYKSIEQANK